MSQFMNFIDDSVPGQKTKRILITRKSQPVVLGEIRWFGQWRRYAFYPQPGCLFDAVCLNDIQSKLVELMNERKAANSDIG